MRPRDRRSRDTLSGCAATSGLLALAFMLVALTLSACGGSGNASRSTASPEPTVAPTTPPATTRPPTPTQWEPQIGEEARLVLEDRSALIGVAISEQAYKDFHKAIAAKDDIGIREMQVVGLLFGVESGTRVLVIDSDGGFFEDLRYRVRILEGRQITRAGWVAGSLLHRP